jgi:hypothetical protein
MNFVTAGGICAPEPARAAGHTRYNNSLVYS